MCADVVVWILCILVIMVTCILALYTIILPFANIIFCFILSPFLSQINQKDILMLLQLFFSNLIMLLVRIVLKPWRHLLILFNCIFPHIMRTVWGSSGVSELTGGQDFTSVKIRYQINVMCLSLSGS